MIGEYLTWQKMSIIFVVLFLIQFITRTKAVADGMVLRQLMVNYNLKANEIVEKMKEQAEEAKKNNDIN